MDRTGAGRGDPCDEYVAAWGACPLQVREFAASDGTPLARARLFDVPAEGGCPP